MNRPVRVAVVDSGVHAGHPHVNGVAGGISILRDGTEQPGYLDHLGHGTAVAAVIREKSPEAEIYAVKIFFDRLATGVGALVQAIEWSVLHGMHFVNLSLGPTTARHNDLLRESVTRARAAGVIVVGPGHPSASGWLPVALDWDCPRDRYRTATLADGQTLYFASGYPRPIPGVPPERNLKGLSFSVANVTGLLARERAETPA